MTPADFTDQRSIFDYACKIKKEYHNELFLSNGLRELTFMTSTWEGCVCGGGNLEICLMLVDSSVFK